MQRHVVCQALTRRASTLPHSSQVQSCYTVLSDTGTENDIRAARLPQYWQTSAGQSSPNLSSSAFRRPSMSSSLPGASLIRRDIEHMITAAREAAACLGIMHQITLKGLIIELL